MERDARHVRSRSAGRSFPHYVCALRREESREMPCDIIFYRLPSSLPLLRSAPVSYSRLCLSALFSCPISPTVNESTGSSDAQRSNSE